jgi:CRP-like cAMP-binding protein
MSEPPVTLAELRTIDLFEELSDADLSEWIPAAQAYLVPAGELIAEQGAENRGMQLLLRGEAQASIVDGAGSEPVGKHKAPTWMGAIATLTGGALGVRMQAETDCRLALIAAEDFRRLAFEQPVIHRRVMQQVAPVMSRITSREQSRERLTSLGTMAAGLAHELNNPAAAARRSSQQLSEALEVISSSLARFVEAGVDREQAGELVALQQQAVAHAAASTALAALDAADAEDELLEHLEALGVPEPWRLAEPLAVGGVDRAWIDRVA